MRRRQQEQTPVPFTFTNPYRYGSVAVAVLEVGDGYLCVEYQIGVSQVVVFAAKKDEFPQRYTYVGQGDLEIQVAELRNRALNSGATLEAIQLLGQLTPITKPEEATMAQPKLARKTANTADLKAAAKTAPVKGKGNPEALAKARAAKGPQPSRTYKVTKKDNEGREGSWTRHMIDVIRAHTDTDSAKAANSKDRTYGSKNIDFAWAAAKGYIIF